MRGTLVGLGLVLLTPGLLLFALRAILEAATVSPEAVPGVTVLTILVGVASLAALAILVLGRRELPPWDRRPLLGGVLAVLVGHFLVPLAALAWGGEALDLAVGGGLVYLGELLALVAVSPRAARPFLLAFGGLAVAGAVVRVVLPVPGELLLAVGALGLGISAAARSARWLGDNGGWPRPG